jgi:hypothetical protein
MKREREKTSYKETEGRGHGEAVQAPNKKIKIGRICTKIFIGLV